VRLWMGVLVSIALGLSTYAALARSDESISYDSPSPSRPRLAQANGAQSEQSRALGADSDVVGSLTKRIALLEQRVDALEAKNKAATSAIPRVGPRGWVAY